MHTIPLVNAKIMDILDILLAPDILFRLNPRELALRLCDLTANSEPDGIQTITVRLLDGIYSGSVHPSVFRIWLPIAVGHAPALIRTALLDKLSYNVRAAGISALKRALASHRWREDGWDAVGGTQGLVEVVEAIGVKQVGKLVRVIGKFNHSNDPAKAACVDELVRLLMPTLIPSSGSAIPSPDSTGRHFLFCELVHLIPGCSRNLLQELFPNELLLEPRQLKSLFRRLTKYHLSLLRQIATKEIKVHKSVRDYTFQHCSKDLIISVEPYAPVYSHTGISPTVPSGVIFLLDLVFSKHLREILVTVITKLFDLAASLVARRRTPVRDVLILFETIIRLYEKSDCEFSLPDDAPFQVVRYWAAVSFPRSDLKSSSSSTVAGEPLPASKTGPELAPAFTSLLIRLIKRSEIDGRHYPCWAISDYFVRVFQSIPSKAKLPFIKIIYSHLPSIGINLEATSVPEKQLPKLAVCCRVLQTLPCEDAKWLFEHVTSIAGGQNTPRCHHAVSPLKSWCREDLLRVHWEANEKSGDDNPIAEKCTPFCSIVSQSAGTNISLSIVINDAKGKAERSSHADERLKWAEYCMGIAVMSKSIILLDAVVTWSGRFLRDPVRTTPIWPILLVSNPFNRL